MPKLTSQYQAFPRVITALGGPISLSGAETVPVYSRPMFTSDQELLHILVHVYRAAGSGIDGIFIKMVTHYDITAAPEEWFTMVNPVKYIQNNGVSGVGAIDVVDQFGVMARQNITLRTLKALDTTERYSMIFKTGEQGSRLPFARWEFITKGASDPLDMAIIYLPGGPDGPPGTGNTDFDPGDGQGDDLDP